MPRFIAENPGASRGGYDPAARLADFAAARHAFAAGASTPRAWLEERLAAITGREPGVHAFCHLDLAGARTAADQSTARWKAGRPLSALDGCAVGIKDTIDVRDMPSEMNSPIFKGHVPGHDGACVLALRQAGAVILGKTWVPELALGLPPPTRNPHDPRRTAGASSSGCGAAVGAGMVPVAIGNQTGGSLIRPSSFNGIYGFKPTHGALNIGGMHPIAASQDHIGPMTASLDDAWRTAWEISDRAGGHGGHPGLTGTAEPPRSLRPARLCWLRTLGWAQLDEASRTVFGQLLAALEAAGVGIVEAGNDGAVAELETLLLEADRLSNDIVMYEARWPMAAYVEGRHAGKISETGLARLRRGLAMTAHDYRAALAGRDAIRRAVRAIAARVDGFITFASSGPAPIDGLLDGSQEDRADAHLRTGSRSFLSPWSMVGGPSFSLPLFAVDGMPLGLQLLGAPDSDYRLCAVARWLDETMG